MCQVCNLDSDVFCRYKIYQIFPRDDDQSEIINELLDTFNASLEVDVLFHSRDLDEPIEVMVKPAVQAEFESFLHDHDIEFRVTIDDLRR